MAEFQWGSDEERQVFESEVERILAARENKGADPAPAPSKIKMNLAGQDFEFNDMNEVQEQMNRFVAAAETKLRAAQAPRPSPQAAPVDDTPKFNFDSFLEKMNKPETVPEAFDYTLQHTPRIQQLENKLNEISTVLAISQFQNRHPELVGGPPEVGQAIETVRRQMGLPMSADGYDAALYLAQARGFITPPQPRGAQVPAEAPVAPPTPQRQAPARPADNPYLAPPPSPGRNASVASQVFNSYEEADAFYESLSIEELQKLKDQVSRAKR